MNSISGEMFRQVRSPWFSAVKAALKAGKEFIFLFFLLSSDFLCLPAILQLGKDGKTS
jgi:hypothetical protein